MSRGPTVPSDGQGLDPSAKGASADRRRVARLAHLSLLPLTAALIGGCVGQVESTSVPAGFWAGLGDGFLILFKYIGSHLSDLGIYDSFNTGWPYDLGYFLGATTFIGVGRMAASPW